MSRTFIYAKVSTVDQNTDNAIREIESAGFAANKRRIVCESISGSVAAAERPQFARLLDRSELGDVLIVTKLDRLGHNAMDVRATVEQLAADSVRVHCLALGGVDLTSAAGKMTMSVLSAVAEFERDLLIERTQAGIARARAEGKVLGRSSELAKAQQVDAVSCLAAGESVAKLARDFETTRQSIMRVRPNMFQSVQLLLTFGQSPSENESGHLIAETNVCAIIRRPGPYMPRRSILSSAERDNLMGLPEGKDDLIRHYSFTESDLSLIRQRRGDANRLGFAVQLCLLRYPGHAVASEMPVPA